MALPGFSGGKEKPFLVARLLPEGRIRLPLRSHFGLAIDDKDCEKCEL
jgi:hypothetical protein